MTYSQRIALSFAFTASVALAATAFAAEKMETSKVGQDQTMPPAAAEKADEKTNEVATEKAVQKTDEVVTETKTPVDEPKAAGDEEIKAVVQEAIEKGNDKLTEEIDRVPGLKYDDISRISSKIPGKVQIPDPTSKNSASRAISVPGGLVSQECKHFARGFIAKRLMLENAGLTPEAAMSKVVGHLNKQRITYAKIAGKEGLKRSEAAIHDAKCPVCGPLNAAEIKCHTTMVTKSPIRELVMFDFASDVLRGGYMLTVQQIKALLEVDPSLQVALIGRASIPGGPVPNFALSARRITSVWHGLAKTGVPVDRIVAIPIGEDEPHIDLQLAIDYGLDGDFAEYGQQPLNQSVYMVVFRPEQKMSSSIVGVKSQAALPRGATLESKKKRIMQYLSGEKDLKTIKN